MKSERGTKYFDMPSKKIPKKFSHVGLTHFLTLIMNSPGTMEGLLRGRIKGAKLVGRVA